MSFLALGTIFHCVLGAALTLLVPEGTTPLMTALIFLANERGELKQRLPGSIRTWGKNWRVLKALFGQPTVVVQWLAPTLTSAAVLLVL